MKKKLWIIFPFIFSLLPISCQEKNPCNLSAEVLKELDTLESWIKTPEIQDFDIKRMKNSYNEPSLFNAKTETYRFIWNSTFEGRKVYRIEENNGQYRAIIKIYTDTYDTTGITKEFEISKDIWNNIVNTLAANNFWAYLHLSKEKAMYLDPTTITIEGYKPIKDKCTLKNYHFIARQSFKDTAFVSMYRLFYELDKK
tara:strand:+ start:262 stop:855 length:594 start_codon:yes stop_codon:yes gene_type:complete